jgi:hypothetical protein
MPEWLAIALGVIIGRLATHYTWRGPVYMHKRARHIPHG